MTALAPSLRRTARVVVLTAAVAVSTGVSGYAVGTVAKELAGNRMAPWIVGRAAGVCSYVLLVALVMMGLLLSHPWRARIRRPSSATRIRAHIALAAFTVAFIALHIVALATDRYAGVGWWGALLPMRASYRPVATSLGVIALWAGLLAGITAALAGHLPRRLWWPIHKVAAIALVLAWAHGVFGGGDTPALLALYLGSAGAVLVLAISRYSARTMTDLATEVRS